MANQLVNPILPGYYPDPSICRVEDDFYLVCSSFEMCPGLPVFHSRDLMHWEQVGNAMTPENGLHVERNCGVGGLMAPTLRYLNSVYYIINANFCDKGNYIITASDPRGPWSEPHWLDDVPGIDTSMFFDNDGQAYVLGTGNVWKNGAGEMEPGIWLASYDIERFRMTSEPVAIFNTALRVGLWPEAPHLYHIQAMNHQLHLERAVEQGRQVVRAVLVTADYAISPYIPGFTSETNRSVLKSAAWDKKDIVLQLEMRGEAFTLRYGETKDTLVELDTVDGAWINPEKVGCMCGTLVGMYATGNGRPSDSAASFNDFSCGTL